MSHEQEDVMPDIERTVYSLTTPGRVGRLIAGPFKPSPGAVPGGDLDGAALVLWDGCAGSTFVQPDAMSFHEPAAYRRMWGSDAPPVPRYRASLMPSGLNTQRVTPHLARKARRLIADDRVHRLPGSFVVLVEGETPGSVYAVPCGDGPDLEAENARLRAALEAIDQHGGRPADEDWARAYGEVLSLARGALEDLDEATVEEPRPLGCTCPHRGVCSHIIAARELNETS